MTTGMKTLGKKIERLLMKNYVDAIDKACAAKALKKNQKTFTLADAETLGKCEREELEARQMLEYARKHLQ